MNKEFHKTLIDKFTNLINKTKQYPLVNFYSYFCFQSLLKISDGTTLFGKLFNRSLKCNKDSVLSLIEVYTDKNLEKLYDSYKNLKEAFTFHCEETTGFSSVDN